MANELVRTSLSGVYTESDRICKKCHYKLRQCSIETRTQNVCMCVSCQNNFDHNLTIDFDKANIMRMVHF